MQQENVHGYANQVRNRSLLKIQNHSRFQIQPATATHTQALVRHHRTMESSPVNQRQPDRKSLHFPAMFHPNKESSENIGRGLAKTELILDSLMSTFMLKLGLLRDGSPDKSKVRRVFLTEASEQFSELGRVRRGKPKLIKNQMTAKFFARDIQTQSRNRKVNLLCGGNITFYGGKEQLQAKLEQRKS